MDAPLVQPRLLAFIAVKSGAIGGHQLSLQSRHKVTQGYPSEPTTLV